MSCGGFGMRPLLAWCSRCAATRPPSAASLPMLARMRWPVRAHLESLTVKYESGMSGCGSSQGFENCLAASKSDKNITSSLLASVESCVGVRLAAACNDAATVLTPCRPAVQPALCLPQGGADSCSCHRCNDASWEAPSGACRCSGAICAVCAFARPVSSLCRAQTCAHMC